MLQKLSEQIQACYERAAEAKRRAEEAADLAFKADFLALEQHWLVLARSHAFTESLQAFTAEMSESRRKVDAPNRPGLSSALRLQEISTLLIQTSSVELLAERLLGVVISLMSSDMGSMQVLDPERGELRLLAWSGFHPESAAFWQWVRLDSACACGQALSSGNRVILPDIEACDSIVGTPDMEAYHRSGIRAVQSTPLLSGSGRLLGMMSTHWREPHQPDDRALRIMDVLAQQAAALIERTQAEASLRDSEERSRWLAYIVESSDDAIISTALDGIITSWNKAAERLLGYTAEEAIGKEVQVFIPANRRGEEHGILALIREGERVEPYDTVRRRKDGSLVEVSLMVAPLKDSAGRVIGACKIVRDISARKRAEEQLRTLSHEVDHRARNLMAIVQATVHMSNAPTSHELKAAIEGRIRALAKAHTLLSKTRWKGADLTSLVREELSPYDADGASRISLAGPELRLEPGHAQSIAMVVHELATNAVKYGALSVPAGRIRVDWSYPNNGRLLLRWTEFDGPSVKPPQRQGFGGRVIDQLVRNKLKGEARFDWRAEGLACEIVLPGRAIVA
jgi:PAS domain S-box-containing protein